jgi:hypothetical protein
METAKSRFSETQRLEIVNYKFRIFYVLFKNHDSRQNSKYHIFWADNLMF